VELGHLGGVCSGGDLCRGQYYSTCRRLEPARLDVSRRKTRLSRSLEAHLGERGRPSGAVGLAQALARWGGEGTSSQHVEGIAVWLQSN
jgi:hypothetical protein